MLTSTLITLMCLTAPADGCMHHDTLQTIGAELLVLSGTDQSQAEQAAFITRDSFGDINCVLWPMSGERERATYRGTIPRNLIAIVHTHPNEWIAPSGNDRMLAKQLQVPVFVIIHGGFSVVRPTGELTKSHEVIKAWHRPTRCHFDLPVDSALGIPSVSSPAMARF